MISSFMAGISNCCSPYDDEEDLRELTDYFQDLTKVTIVGEPRVGKTALFHTMLGREDPMNFADYVPTVGRGFIVKCLCRLPF